MLEMRSKLFMPVPGGRSRLNPIRTQMKGYLRAGDPIQGFRLTEPLGQIDGATLHKSPYAR